MAQERRRGQPGGGRGRLGQEAAGEGGAAAGRGDAAGSEAGDGEEELDDGDIDFNKLRGMKSGRASCRERVYISVVAGALQKKKKTTYN